MKKKPWIVVLFALLVIAAVSFTLSSGSAKDAVPQTAVHLWWQFLRVLFHAFTSGNHIM